MKNPYRYSFDNKRYQTMNYYLKSKYNCKIAKVPLNAHFTCPNRDGTKSIGGCTFCSSKGSGDSVLGFNENVMEQYDNLISQGKYTEANNYISQQDGIYLFSADFFNLIENRISATQNYLLTKQPKHPFAYSEEKPENPTLNMLWT